MTNNRVVGKLFDIQKFSIHDGPGIRTLVFFKGCPLRCLWCSNAESQKKKLELMFYKDRCASCGRCVEICPHGNIVLVESSTGISHEIDRDDCTGCAKCVEVCPNDALRLVGFEKDDEAVLSVILQDYLFYMNSGGGVTLGGGEPTMQPEFALAILKKSKRMGIHTAIETCGYTEWRVLESLAEYLDLIFYDIKHMNPDKHKTITGASNRKILDNASRLMKRKAPMVIRIPIIPGINDDRGNLKSTMEFLQKNNHQEAIIRVELLPYHKLGVTKYPRLARIYELENSPKPDPDSLVEAEEVVRSFGFESKIEGI